MKQYYVEITDVNTGKVLWHYFAYGDSKESVNEAANRKFLDENPEFSSSLGIIFMVTSEEINDANRSLFPNLNNNK